VLLAIDAARTLGRELPSFEDAVRTIFADHDRLTRELLAATLDAASRAQLAAVSPPASALASAAGLEHHGAAAGDDAAMLSRVEIMLQLRSLDLFERVTTRDLSELAGVVREETCRPDVIVVEGEVHVTRDGQFVARLKPGEFFGEMALFNGETRFATVTAATRVRLLRLERRDLLQLMDEQPGIAIAMCQTLSGRVRDLISRIEGRAAKTDPEEVPPKT
jgi:CRP-like cAMP-binding protein